MHGVGRAAGRTCALALAVAASIAAGTATARADSLVYAKNGDVWRSAPNGGGATRLTSGGDFVSPSQADDGTIIAVDERSGESCRRQLVRLAPNGKLVRRLNVIGPKSRNLSLLGPWYPEISRDARRVAFGETIVDSDRWSPICQPLYSNSGGSEISQEHVKVSDARTGKPLGLIAPHASLWTPSWLPDGRLLLFAPYNVTASQVGFAKAGQAPTGWFSDPLEDPNAFPPRQYISDGEVSRDGSSIAYIRGENTALPRKLPAIEVARVVALSKPPLVRCDITVRRPPAENPSWSPDGRALAWSEQDGIHVTRIAPGAGGCAAAPRLVIRGGRHPDWGPYGGRGHAG